MEKTKLDNVGRQLGVALKEFLLIAALVVLFFFAGSKVGLIYVDHNLITGLCQDLIDYGETSTTVVTEVRDKIFSTLRINNITEFGANSIRMRKENYEAIITVAHEKWVPLIANLDILAAFEESLLL